MSISFYGSSEFSLIILQKLFELHKQNKINLEYVISQSSKIFGRNKEIKDNPVVSFCKQKNIRFITPEKIKEIKTSEITNIKIDMAVVAAYGKILPEWLLNSTKYGFINFHGSILPAYRGAAPVQFTILNQDIKNAGITIIKMDKGMDTGKIIKNEKLKINSLEFKKLISGELMMRLAELGAQILEKDFDYIFSPEKWNLIKQDDTKASFCYVSDMAKENFQVNYEDGILKAHGKIMAANPEPKAYVKLIMKDEELTMNILRSDLVDIELSKTNQLSLHKSGKKLYLELHDGFIEILEIQPQGKNPMDAMSFMNGYGKVISGSHLAFGS